LGLKVNMKLLRGGDGGISKVTGGCGAGPATKPTFTIIWKESPGDAVTILCDKFTVKSLYAEAGKALAIERAANNIIRRLNRFFERNYISTS
jgi:hypothetical protein